MWDEGLIYKGERIVNYSTAYQTNYADIEVKLQNGKGRIMANSISCSGPAWRNSRSYNPLEKHYWGHRHSRTPYRQTLQ